MKESNLFLYSLVAGLLGISFTESFFNTSTSGIGFIAGYLLVFSSMKLYLLISYTSRKHQHSNAYKLKTSEQAETEPLKSNFREDKVESFDKESVKQHKLKDFE